MSKSYDEIMEEIQVTDAMRDRILQNIANTDMRKKSSEKKKSRIYRWQKYSLTAACLAFVLVCAMALPKLWNSNGQESQMAGDESGTDELTGVTSWGIQECSSAEALSEAAGFPIEEL